MKPYGAQMSGASLLISGDAPVPIQAVPQAWMGGSLTADLAILISANQEPFINL
jgi:hypothetical protein